MADVTLPDVMPVRHRDVEVAEFDTEFVVFDPGCNDVHRLVGVTAVVFDACDGVTSAVELVGELVAVLEMPDDEARLLVEQAIDELTRVGALHGSEASNPPP